MNPMKRPFEGGEPHMPRRAPGRIHELGAPRNTSISSIASVSSVAGPSSSSAPTFDDELMGEDEDEVMDMDADDDDYEQGEHMVIEHTTTPSPERERRMRIAGTSSQRAAAAMLVAKTTNMRGQWRQGSLLVPVPNSRGRPPPSDLPVSSVIVHLNCVVSMGTVRTPG